MTRVHPGMKGTEFSILKLKEHGWLMNRAAKCFSRNKGAGPTNARKRAESVAKIRRIVKGRSDQVETESVVIDSQSGDDTG